jgi:hypothetical protein
LDLGHVASAYEQIAKLGFPFVLFIILAGSYLDLWRWGKACRASEAKLEARELELKAEIVQIKLAAAEREESQQKLIERLLEKMVEGAGLIAASAKRVGR